MLARAGIIRIPLLALLASLATAAVHAEPVDFNRQIRPILADRCFACHGPDAQTRKGNLRLDLEAEAKKSAIVPGDPDKSELIARISHPDPEERMPPAEAKKPALSPTEADTFRRWIAEGAPWPTHWAFVPVVQPPVPTPKGTWGNNPIDRFILARLEAEGLAPAPEADKATLLRRLSFDLIGLPPTLEEMDAFLADTTPEAYEKAVDRLLAAPQYGERMAIDWLDGARYADTNGYQNDFQREMWPWRDWVINAYNDNMPFDTFTVEQIAGDLLPNATQNQRIATGFCRNNRTTTEGGSIEEEWLLENLVDRVETVSTVFLGLTMGCARCHEHKYDPISQREFYEFLAYFNSTKDKGFYNETRGNTGPIVTLPTPENEAKLKEWDERIAKARKELEDASGEKAPKFEAFLKTLTEATPTPPTDTLLSLPLLGNLDAGPKATATWPAPTGPRWGEGLLGPSLELDGTPEAHLDLAQAVHFDATEPYTVSAWIRPESEGALYSKMDDANGYRGTDILLGAGAILAVHIVSTWPEDAIKVYSEGPIPLGAWSHLCVTYDGSGKAGGLRCYLNGTRIAMKPERDTLKGDIATDQPLRIGRRSSGAYLKGAIAAFRIHDRALLTTEIRDLIQADLASAATSPNEARRAALQTYFDQRETANLKRKQERLDKTIRDRDEYIRVNVTSVMVMEESEEPRPTYRMIRGQYDKPDTSEILQPSTPDFLPPLPEGAPNNRLGLARWIVAPENPLTARVTVNRIWAKFFGHGLVTTPENFGQQCEAPSHPELLDWLAAEFVNTGWDLKALQKHIVLSATYRQDSKHRDELLTRDPENRLLARGPRFRLPAELIRDNALAISGLLAPRIGGPPVRPYQPAGLWDEIAGGAGQGPYIQDTGEGLYRRTLYTYRKRTVSHPLVSTFDAPSWETCRVYRARTNTPLQALALLNDITYVEAARHLATRMLQETPESPARDRLRHGFRLATGRIPNPTEENILMAGLLDYLETYQHDTQAATTYATQGESPVPEHLDRIQLAAYTALAQVLLNMDATITKE